MTDNTPTPDAAMIDPTPEQEDIADLNPWHVDRVIASGEGQRKKFLAGLVLSDRKQLQAAWTTDPNGALLFDRKHLAAACLTMAQATAPREAMGFERVPS